MILFLANSLKYSLIFTEPGKDKKILIDNHYPKKPHVHINDKQINYKYTKLENLIDDFKKHVLKHFGVKL